MKITIKDRRLTQPLAELQRKAKKAQRRKQKIWTVEEIEAAKREAEELGELLGWKIGIAQSVGTPCLARCDIVYTEWKTNDALNRECDTQTVA